MKILTSIIKIIFIIIFMFLILGYAQMLIPVSKSAIAKGYHFYSFLAGSIIFLILWYILFSSRSGFWSTLEHELTHALFALVFFKKIHNISASRKSGGHITIEGGNIIIGAEETPNQWDPEGAKQVVHLWVKDDGIGISIEDQAKIFTKFFRSDDSKAREAPGTGLGLNITKSLVEMQGGRIWFESEYRQGTTFHFTIPVAEG